MQVIDRIREQVICRRDDFRYRLFDFRNYQAKKSERTGALDIGRTHYSNRFKSLRAK